MKFAKKDNKYNRERIIKADNQDNLKLFMQICTSPEQIIDKTNIT